MTPATSPSATQGVLTFNAPPDYEAPESAGAENVYLVEVRASDGTHMPIRYR